MVTVQTVPSALSQPLQPLKVLPEAAAAVMVMVVPVVYVRAHPAAQVPPEERVTVPLPLPPMVTQRSEMGYSPVPLKLMVLAGFIGSLLVICSVPPLAPVEVGRNPTLIVQLLPGPMVGVRLEQLPGATLNMVLSVPVVEIPVTFRFEAPTLLMVTVLLIELL